jgi:hypothetical protein
MIKNLDGDSPNQYLGYYVEWEASFEGLLRPGSVLTAHLFEESSVYLSLVSDMAEIVQRIKRKTRVKFCGVIMKIGALSIDLDYVEIVGLTNGCS